MHLIFLLPAATIHVFAPTELLRSSVTSGLASQAPPVCLMEAPCFGLESAISVLPGRSWAGGLDVFAVRIVIDRV